MYTQAQEVAQVTRTYTNTKGFTAFQKSATPKPFDFSDILKEDQELGIRLHDNFKHIAYLNGQTITGLIKAGNRDYCFNLSPSTLLCLGHHNRYFSSTYIRLLEILLQLVLGYHFQPFDLVLKNYYQGIDELPEILPVGERDTFSKKVKKPAKPYKQGSK